MQRKYLFSLSLITIFGLAVTVFWWFNNNAAQAKKNNVESNPFEAINTKAKDAQRGDVESSKELVREIISVSGFENELRGFTASAVMERVGNAQSRYQSGQSEGTSESAVARTINGLAIKFNLPEFARTDTYEVRRLRLSLMPNFPGLIGQKPNGVQPLSNGEKFDSKMSPAEAVLILSMMMHQKLANKHYQLTKAERLTLWEQKYGKRQSNRQTPSLDELTKDRSGEIDSALRRSADALSIPDTLQLSTLILNTLGIDK